MKRVTNIWHNLGFQVELGASDAVFFGPFKALIESRGVRVWECFQWAKFVSVFVVFFKPQFNSIDKHQHIGARTRGESQTPIRVIFECASDSESTRLCACMSRTHSGHPIRWIAYNRSHHITFYLTSNLSCQITFAYWLGNLHLWIGNTSILRFAYK